MHTHLMNLYTFDDRTKHRQTFYTSAFIHSHSILRRDGRCQVFKDLYRKEATHDGFISGHDVIPLRRFENTCGPTALPNSAQLVTIV